jgi:hypothetical protein
MSEQPAKSSITSKFKKREDSKVGSNIDRSVGWFITHVTVTEIISGYHDDLEIIQIAPIYSPFQLCQLIFQTFEPQIHVWNF